MQNQTIILVGKFLLGCVCAVMLTETVLRLIEVSPAWRVLPVVEAGLYSPDHETGYRHRPGASGIWVTENRTKIQINEHGLRSKPVNLDADPNHYRVLVLGDSITEALQVKLDQTFVVLTANRLLEDGYPVEMINLGLAGATPAVLIARLASIGKTLTPSLVVVIASIGDFLSPTGGVPSSYTVYERNIDGAMTLSHKFRNSFGFQFRTSLAGKTTYWLIDNFRTIGILNQRKNKGWFPQWKNAWFFGAKATTGLPRDECAVSPYTQQIELWRAETDNDIQDRFSAFLRDLDSFSKSQNVPAILTLRGINTVCTDFAKQRKLLIKAIETRLNAHGIGFVDMRAKLLALAGTEKNVWMLQGFGVKTGINGHLNTNGHELYASVFEVLVRTAIYKHQPDLRAPSQ